MYLKSHSVVFENRPFQNLLEHTNAGVFTLKKYKIKESFLYVIWLMMLGDVGANQWVLSFKQSNFEH